MDINYKKLRGYFYEIFELEKLIYENIDKINNSTEQIDCCYPEYVSKHNEKINNSEKKISECYIEINDLIEKIKLLIK